ncbi:MAG: sugar phosphate nucleotidyltransferase, partial [Spirochaetota bacterium]
MADATIIMAGGSGTRLWPASTPAHPKQLLRLGGRHSLVQQAVMRALAATPDGPLLIVTHRDHVAPIAVHMRELARELAPARESVSTRESVSARASAPGLLERIVYLPEPVARNTAPAIALGVRYLERRLSPATSVLVLTADHVIEPVERFA